MIVGYFHEGSGLGNQLHRYVMTRVLAKDKGCEFGMIGNFKGDDFMKIDKGLPVPLGVLFSYNTFQERKLEKDGVDIRPYDVMVNFVTDKTVIDGEFQDELYFEHSLGEVREWLKVEPLEMLADLCVINFRGGEYVGVPDLFLPQEYWNLAIKKMKEINPDMKFVVHTDDYGTASKFFPDYPINFYSMSENWRSIRYAKYLILSNSSFAILPALLNENAKKIIAPRFWAGYNKGFWQLVQNYYKKFHYIHHENK